MLRKTIILTLGLFAFSLTTLGSGKPTRSRLPKGFHQATGKQKIDFMKNNPDMAFYAFSEDPNLAQDYAKLFMGFVQKSYTLKELSPSLHSKPTDQLTEAEIEKELLSIPTIQDKIDQFSRRNLFAAYIFLIAYDRICKHRGVKKLYQTWKIPVYEETIDKYFALTNEPETPEKNLALEKASKPKLDSSGEPISFLINGESFAPTTTAKMKQFYKACARFNSFRDPQHQIIMAKYIIHGRKLGY